MNVHKVQFRQKVCTQNSRDIRGKELLYFEFHYLRKQNYFTFVAINVRYKTLVDVDCIIPFQHFRPKLEVNKVAP